jgi:gliding motility-associated-like protein
MKKFYIILILFVCSIPLFSQRGKDGTVTVGASTIVNVYTSLTANLVPGNVTIPVTSTVGFSVGDLIYIIQVQGASTNCVPETFNPQNSFPMSDDFGRITNYNNAGNNEYAHINSIFGNDINVDCGINNAYTAAGKVQVIRVPRFAQLTINSGGTITCPQWNGTTGGVIAIEVMGNTVINTGGSINASNLGFRGGLVTVTGYTHTASTNANNWGHLNKNLGMYKGESIVGDTAVYQTMAAKFCKGAIGNGGGGGTEVNAGGGGGSNAGDTALWTGKGNPDNSLAGWTTAWNLESPGFAASSSSGGGRGGYTYAVNALNPTTVPPGSGNGWGGDNRRLQGGLGGRPLDYTTGRLFIGGGGGSGDEDNAYGGAGGNGGGIIHIVSYGTISGGGSINANGANGSPSKTPGTSIFNTLTGKDGAGGAGGGGAIRINSLGSVTGISLNAIGGNGGNQEMRTTSNSADAYGPGGGGGGGYIGSNTALPTTNVSGGNNGIVTYISGVNSCQIDNLFPPNGATRGGVGIVTNTLSTIPTITVSPTAATICVNNSVSLTAGNSEGYAMGWYYQNPGGSFVGFGPAFTTSVYTTPGTYTVSVGTCPNQFYRAQCIITVIAGPTLVVNSPTICSGQTATLNGSGATTYTWNTGPTTGTINVTPTVTTTYTLAGTIATCSSNITTTVNVISAPSITATPVSICNGQTATVTASGATSYTWNTGSTTNSIIVTPTTTTNYTVTGSVGTCTSVQTTTVTVNSLPSVTVTSSTICAGGSATLTAGGATTYTWNTGPTTTSITVTPTTTTNYTVTGSNGSCSDTQTTSIIVNPLPTVTATSGSICAGQSLTLTAGGASTYTWNTGPTTATIALSPTTTTNYTVTGNNGTCSNTQTTSITVVSLPTVTATSGTICAGGSATLTAGGATTYTWNTGPTTTSITVTPTTTTNYTVTGSNGACINTSTTEVVVNPNPTITVNSPTLCSGQTTTLTASGASTYTWSPGPLNGSSVTVSPGTTQVYTVTGTSSLTCSGTNTTTVSVTATPTLNVPSATICPGNTATLTASGGTSYTWNPGGSTGSTFTATPPATTVYTVTGANGACTSTQTVSINIGAAISIAVNSPSICAGETATLTASGATTYTWSTGSNSSSVTVNPTSTTVYTISGTSSSCSGVNTATVNINTTPTVSVAAAAICSGQTATLTAGGAATYTWNPGSLSGSSVTVSPTSTQNYTVIGSSAEGCTNTAISNVSVTTTPTVVVQPMSICPGGTGTLTAMGAGSYTWNPGNVTGSSYTASPSSTTNYTVTGSNGLCVSSATADITVGTSLTVAINSPTICSGESTILSASVSATSYTWNTGANTSTVVVTPTTTTSYTVDVTSPGCNGTGTTTVFVSALPTVTVNGAAICSGQMVTLTAGGASNYTWTPSGVNGSTFAVAPTTSTTYSVIGETGGCTNIATTDVTVTPTPTLTVNSPTICAGSATLTASGATNYTWSPGGQNTSSIVVSPSTTSFYTVDAANGSCFTTTTTMVYVNSAPPLVVDVFNPSPFCPGSCNTFSTTTGYGSVVFDYGDATGTTTNTTHCYAASGNYTVTASGTFTSGCSITTSTMITVSFLPVNTVTFDILGSAPYQLGSAISFTSYGLSGNWTFGDGTSLTNTPDPMHAFNSGGTYCIKMVSPTTTLSCTDSLTKCIDIIQPVTINIPNVFTPNADGNNDVFKITGAGIIDFHCVILDRWGLRMYEWDGLGGGWDGYTKAGVQAPSGTYFYIITYRTSDGKGDVVKGPVSLFKD